MSFVRRELDRIESALRESPAEDKYRELYAAQQALAWALDPACYRAPTDAITGAPLQPVTGIPAG